MRQITALFEKKKNQARYGAVKTELLALKYFPTQELFNGEDRRQHF